MTASAICLSLAALLAVVGGMCWLAFRALDYMDGQTAAFEDGAHYGEPHSDCEDA